MLPRERRAPTPGRQPLIITNATTKLIIKHIVVLIIVILVVLIII